jgi:hypothetical protein
MLRTMHNEVHDIKEFQIETPCYDIYVLHRALHKYISFEALETCEGVGIK